MNIYHVSGSDGSSDNGYWELIITAAAMSSARAIARRYLKDNGRPELCENTTISQIKTKPILYTTVETRR